MKLERLSFSLARALTSVTILRLIAQHVQIVSIRIDNIN
ncbi:hypothetical protein V1477_013177 [Vespula maculifrons]|uniref:Uncharacterized protein n=1 Tax=Vespula maculifrons TaxID=7453 RepID=A0ABD2BWN7_VESMC